MSTINEVMEAVIGLMNATHPYATVTRGALPTGYGLTCEISPGVPERIFLSKNRVAVINVTMNGKHANLKTVSDAMNKIHSILTRAKNYPEGDSWQILDIRNVTLPAIIGRETNNEWLMASSLSVHFFWRGD